jgi:aerobic-type carbon monoxide dehydrogenase small subunit (CoxS/CutS family)
MLRDEHCIGCVVNGKPYTLQVKANETLAVLLREKLGLMGTKVGCEQGECGACTVLMDGKAVNSCLVLAPEVDGCEITTIEGLAKDGMLDPVQKAFIKEGAVQCGYCIPGMIMSTKGLLLENSEPDEDEIKHALSGNFCRCTGYYSIIRAVKTAAKMIRDQKDLQSKSGSCENF